MTSRDLDRMLADLGWHLVRQARHRVYHCSCGEHIMSTAATPSDHRSVKNALAEARRCPGGHA